MDDWIVGLFEDTENGILLDKDELLTVNFDRSATVLGDQDAVTDCHFKSNSLAGLILLASAEGNDLGLL